MTTQHHPKLTPCVWLLAATVGGGIAFVNFTAGTDSTSDDLNLGGDHNGLKLALSIIAGCAEIFEIGNHLNGYIIALVKRHDSEQLTINPNQHPTYDGNDMRNGLVKRQNITEHEPFTFTQKTVRVTITPPIIFVLGCAVYGLYSQSDNAMLFFTDASKTDHQVGLTILTALLASRFILIPGGHTLASIWGQSKVLIRLAITRTNSSEDHHSQPAADHDSPFVLVRWALQATALYKKRELTPSEHQQVIDKMRNIGQGLLLLCFFGTHLIEGFYLSQAVKKQFFHIMSVLGIALGRAFAHCNHTLAAADAVRNLIDDYHENRCRLFVKLIWGLLAGGVHASQATLGATHYWSGASSALRTAMGAGVGFELFTGFNEGVLHFPWDKKGEQGDKEEEQANPHERSSVRIVPSHLACGF